LFKWHTSRNTRNITKRCRNPPPPGLNFDVQSKKAEHVFATLIAYWNDDALRTGNNLLIYYNDIPCEHNFNSRCRTV
jgi:hypothetical protein